LTRDPFDYLQNALLDDVGGGTRSGSGLIGISKGVFFLSMTNFTAARKTPHRVAVPCIGMQSFFAWGGNEAQRLKGPHQGTIKTKI